MDSPRLGISSRSGSGASLARRVPSQNRSHGRRRYGASGRGRGCERSAALMVRLGAKPGTQNIDRILRLPGTTNLPNKKKREACRVSCPTKLISFNGASYPLDSFPLPEQNKPGSPEDGGHHARQRNEDQTHEGGDKLERIIRLGENGEFKGDRSDAVWYVVCEMLRRGSPDRAIVST